MHRIDDADRAQDLFGPGKDGFTEGNGSTIPATVVTDDWLNDVQENVAGPIEYAGLDLAKGEGGQLLQAIRGLVNHSLLGVLTQRTPDSSYSNTFRAVTYGDGLFVAVGMSGEIQTSPDGVVWTQRHSGGSQFNGVTHGDGTFVAVGGAVSPRISSSDDGITWTSRTPDAAAGVSDVTYGDGLFVAVGASGEIQTSPDGVVWTQRHSGGSHFNGVTHGDGTFVAVGASGSNVEIQTSPDGVVWTPRAPGGSGSLQFNDVAHGDGLFVIAGANAEIQTSPDGVVWTQRAPGGVPSGHFLGSVHVDGLFVTMGSFGRIHASIDGEAWRQVPSVASAGFHAAVQHPDLGHVVVVGGDGAIYTTPALL